MSLVKSVGTIGGLTMVSRMFGFARDMLLSRLLGAGTAADAFFVAFKFPNIFRRLFAEGAFSAAFVPMFSKELHGGGTPDAGMAAAREFTRQVLSVFLPVLFVFTALAEIVMPWIVWLMASAYQDVPGKFELTVALTRVTFVYLMLVSLVSLLAGVLNSMSRFAAAAAAPILLNICLIVAVLTFGTTEVGAGYERDFITARALAVAVSIAGVLQFLWLLWAVHSAGLRLDLTRPRLTPRVKRLLKIILPATFGAGIYQVSQLVDVFFATRLTEGAMSYLNYADRLNQLPLGVIGIALGTAILPALSRFVGRDDADGARRLMSQALELSMLFTIPAAVALVVCSEALVVAIFLGGRFGVVDAEITANVMAALACGLPAYVLIKVFTPGYYARGDTRTPVKTALVALIVNVGLILVLIDELGVVALPASAATAAWVNCALLYAGLARRGRYRLDATVALRVGKQIAAAALMGAALWWLSAELVGLYAGGIAQRAAALGAIVATGLLTYFATLFAIGGVDRAELAKLRRPAPSQ